MLALAACGAPQGPRPEVVSHIITQAGGKVGAPISLSQTGLIAGVSAKDALQELRAKGFLDADPAPCKGLMPEAARPAAAEYTDIEPAGDQQIVRRILICLHQEGEGGNKALAITGVLAASQKQSLAKDGGKPK